MRPVTTRIDEALCDGCGLCVRVCPSDTLALEGGKAKVVGERSLWCGHCEAVCPKGAVKVEGLDPSVLELETLSSRVPPSLDPADLAGLMKSRFSCRAYKDEPVSLDLLEDLVRIGTTAPTGTNSQKWTFTILPERGRVMELGRLVAEFYEKVNRMARNPLLRGYSRLFAGGELGKYYREYYPMVQKALAEWRETGRDRLFHGAPAALVIGSLPGASCPGEDALLAAGWMTLAAHSMGLGTCLVGYAVEAAKREKRIRRWLGLRPGETVHAVLVLGRPALAYKGEKRRLKPLLRVMRRENGEAEG